MRRACSGDAAVSPGRSRSHPFGRCEHRPWGQAEPGSLQGRSAR